jgi:hypothetical protein
MGVNQHSYFVSLAAVTLETTEESDKKRCRQETQSDRFFLIFDRYIIVSCMSAVNESMKWKLKSFRWRTPRTPCAHPSDIFSRSNQTPNLDG